MRAVESLIREHQLIGSLADALEAYAHQTKQGRPLDAIHLGLFAAAFVDFAECIHHEKEENILLPMLCRHGVRWEQGTLAAVRREHRQESYLIDVLRQAGQCATSWNDEDRRQVVATAEALVDFQRNHHLLESRSLFPLITTRLEAKDLAELQEALERFDRSHATLRASAIAQIELLLARYAPGHAAGAPESCSAVLVDAGSSARCLGTEK